MLNADSLQDLLNVLHHQLAILLSLTHSADGFLSASIQYGDIDTCHLMQIISGDWALTKVA
jgi:hypothetical protein